MRRKLSKKKSRRVAPNKGKGLFPALLHVRVTSKEKAYVETHGGSVLIRTLLANAAAAAKRDRSNRRLPRRAA